jgi:hypothetical protein
VRRGAADHAEAINDREHEVHEHHRRVQLVRGSQRLGAVTGKARVVAARVQPVDEHDAGRFVIIDDKNNRLPAARGLGVASAAASIAW